MSRIVRQPYGRLDSRIVRPGSSNRRRRRLSEDEDLYPRFHLIAEVTMNDTGSFVFGLAFNLYVYYGSTLVDSDSTTPSLKDTTPFTLSVTEAGAVQAIYEGTSFTSTLNCSAGSLAGKTWWPYLGIDNGLGSTYPIYKANDNSPSLSGTGYTRWDNWVCGSFSDDFDGSIDGTWVQAEGTNLISTFDQLGNSTPGTRGGVYWDEKTPAAAATMTGDIIRYFGSGAHTIRAVFHENKDWF